MSGEIKIIFRRGLSKDRRYPYYPYWCIEVTDEDNYEKKAIITLSHVDLKNLLEMAMKQEIWVDITRKRNPDFGKWKKFFEDIMTRVQSSLSDFDIPNIYKYKEENNGKTSNK